MKTFNEFVETRNIAYLLVDNNIDVDAFCEGVINLYEQGNLSEKSINELWGGIQRGIQGLAAGASGLAGLGRSAAGGAAGLAGRGAQAVGQAGLRGAQAVGRAGQSGAQWLGDKAQAAGQAGAQAAQAAGKWAGDKYAAGQREQFAKQATDRVDQLIFALKNLGADETTLTNVRNWVHGTTKRLLQGQPGLRAGTAPRNVAQAQGSGI